MNDLELLAADLGVSGRTLRRAISRGLVRGLRTDGGRYQVPASERRYLRSHWKMLQTLLGALRTEPNVRLAVLFGSAARGDGSAESDLDLVVHFQHPERLAAASLSLKLAERLGREVQIVSLEEAQRSPTLLRDLLQDGRTLVEREGDWKRLRKRARAIERDAQRDEARLERLAWGTVDALAR